MPSPAFLKVGSPSPEPQSSVSAMHVSCWTARGGLQTGSRELLGATHHLPRRRGSCCRPDDPVDLLGAVEADDKAGYNRLSQGEADRKRRQGFADLVAERLRDSPSLGKGKGMLRA